MVKVNRVLIFMLFGHLIKPVIYLPFQNFTCTFVPGHPLAQIHCITPMRVDVLLGEILMSQNDTPRIG